MADDEKESEERTDLAELSAFVERLTYLVQGRGLTSLEIKTDDITVKIRANEVVSAAPPPPPPPVELPVAIDGIVPELTGSVMSS